MDGQEIDSGVAAEVGYGVGKGKIVLGYRGDFRQSGENQACRVNLQVEYFINFSGGRIAGSLDELVRLIKEYYPKLKPLSEGGEGIPALLMEANGKTFAQLFKDLRYSLVMSQRDLARRSGVNVSTVRRIETEGANPPRFSTVRKFLHGLGIDEKDNRAQVLFALFTDEKLKQEL